VFERKMFIKDLYNLKEIYSSFREIEFLHTKDFITHMEKGYLFEKQMLTVHVETTEDVVSLVSLLAATEISKNSIIKLYPETKEVLQDILDATENGIQIKNTILALEYDKAEYLVDVVKKDAEYFKENSTQLVSLFTSENFFVSYKRDMALLLRAHYQKMRYDLRFDYKSFEEAPIKTLHTLRFVCNQIFVFCQSKLQTEIACADKEYERKSGYRKISILYSDNAKKCYIDNLGQIFLDKEMKICYLREPEKKKSLTELSKIRSLIDIKFEPETSPFNNYLIDLQQNLEIMRDIYVPPYTSVMIDRWLEGKEL
jgi:hypothetical protein